MYTTTNLFFIISAGHEHGHDQVHPHSFPDNHLHDLVRDYHHHNDNDAEVAIQKKFNLLKVATEEIKSVLEHHINDD